MASQAFGARDSSPRDVLVAGLLSGTRGSQRHHADAPFRFGWPRGLLAAAAVGGGSLVEFQGAMVKVSAKVIWGGHSDQKS